jgi:transcriptional regulator GlxA family with amidase domain
MLNIAILAVDDCILSSIVGPQEFFAVANDERASLAGGPAEDFCHAEIVTAGGRTVTSCTGVPVIPRQAMEHAGVLDLVLVPGMRGGLETVLARTEILAWLIGQHRQGACLASVCAGSFLLAAAGLLDGRTATTHWMLVDTFRRMFPRVDLQPKKMLVDAGEIITAGGVTAYLDLALYLVRRFGSPELAARCSKVMLVDGSRRLQTPYMSGLFRKAHGDPSVRRAQIWLEEHFREPVSVSALAAVAGLGERTFLRRFRSATGEAPLAYLQQLRIDSARTLLETTEKSVDQITWDIGYENSSSFRRLFKRVAGMSPQAYRKRFGQGTP